MSESHDVIETESQLKFWVWAGALLGLPSLTFVAYCCMACSNAGARNALTCAVPCLIGFSIGCLAFAPIRGALSLPKTLEKMRGWCVVLLSGIAVAQITVPFLRMCRSTAQYVHAPCLSSGFPPVNISPVVFICCEPPYYLALFDALLMIAIGLGSALFIRIVAWMLPMLPMAWRRLWRIVTPGWTRLPVAVFALITLSAFFVEPLVRFAILIPMEKDAEGIALIDDLVRRQDLIRAGVMKPPKEATDPVLLHPREPLLEIYRKYGASCKPGYEHISCAELSRLTKADRDTLMSILTYWGRQKAIDVLQKTWRE